MFAPQNRANWPDCSTYPGGWRPSSCSQKSKCAFNAAMPDEADEDIGYDLVAYSRKAAGKRCLAKYGSALIRRRARRPRFSVTCWLERIGWASRPVPAGQRHKASWERCSLAVDHRRR